MSSKAIASSSGFADSKLHYAALDGLRGVAAIMVLLFHILETFSGGDHSKQIINHGYLAVDFFFMLSGFVIGYAYDDRWNKMSLGGFFKRRLIRLHPMIIMGMLVGAVLFYFQAGPAFPNISGTPVWKMLLIMLIGFTLIPLPLSMDIRGWTEMHPLNGPAWSLFFEYVANILYALVLRRLPNIILGILVAMAGAALIHLAVTSRGGDLIGGWSLEPAQLRIGFTRLLYPFLAGLLLSRICKPRQFNNALLWCSLLLILVLSLPHFGDHSTLWVNGLYDSLAVILVFPVIIYIGAGAKPFGEKTGRLNQFLGDISYPLYITHYPIIYVFTGWASRDAEFIKSGSTTALLQAILAAVAVFVAAIALAWLCVKFYDVPVRKWLTKKWMTKRAINA